MLFRRSFRGVACQETKLLAGFLRGSNRLSSLVKSISTLVLSDVRAAMGDEKERYLVATATDAKAESANVS